MSDAPEFRYTLYPNGKVQTLIVDGTNWVTVSTANSMADRARADEKRVQHDGRECVCARTEKDTRAEVLERLRAKVKALRLDAATNHAEDATISTYDTVLALLMPGEHRAQ